MSRIQQVLNKAEREGTVRRARNLPAQARQEEASPAAIAGAGAAAAESSVAAAGTLTVVEANPDAQVVAAVRPSSAAAEQYRALRTRIAFMESAGKAYRTILVTSPGRAEGKTLTAANLALTMAQEFRRKVVLVDADLRKADMHRCLGLEPSPGLAEVLAGEASLAEALVELGNLNLTFLPAGTPPERPAELLGSSAMRALLGELRTSFDRVIIDTAPAAMLADAGIISPMVDGILMVVRAGLTTTPAIEHVLADLDRSRLIGLVLNGTGARPTSYQAGYAYGQGASEDGAYRSRQRRRA